MSRFIALWALVGLLSAGCSEGSGTSTDPGRTVTTLETSYSPLRTRRCLEALGLVTRPVPRTDSRLRALADLAQRNSFAVVGGAGNVAGVAFGDAALLADLLEVPNDPYRIETRGNALLMYRPAARPLASRVRGCLRP